MNTYRITFDNSIAVDRVLASDATEEIIREQMDVEITKGWIDGVTTDNTYTIATVEE